MRILLVKADNLGAVASILCLVHCLATPLIFVAQSCSAKCCTDAPDWWHWIDYFFLIISFLAVYRSTQTTAKKFMKPALWISWGALLFTILNEKLQWISIGVNLVYVAAVVLVALHIYNLKFCQCKEENCCVHQH